VAGWAAVAALKVAGWAAAAAGVAVLVSGCSSKAAASRAQAHAHDTTQHGGVTTRPVRLGAPNFVYFGATVKRGQVQAPYEMSIANEFQRHAGKGLAIISWGSPWYSARYCSGYCQFVPSEFDVVRAHGSIPFLSWGPFPGNGTFTDAAIAAGDQDAYLTQWATEVKTWGHPLFLRLAWEMNGSWYPWGVGVRGTTPQQFVAMWRHVHDVFQRVGARNVTWVWCPNVDAPTTFKPLRALYPGNSYVDWTCADGYNGASPWLTFGDLYRDSYAQITSFAPRKPVMLAEVSSTEHGGSKAGWISDMFTVLPTVFPDVRALLWYEDDDPGPGGHTDWAIESSPSAQAAFAAGIANGLYKGNQYRDLNVSPIPPPR
jgi:hypothetical protein